MIALSERDARTLDGTGLYDYYFGWGKEEKAAATVLGYGSLCSHSPSPNTASEACSRWHHVLSLPCDASNGEKRSLSDTIRARAATRSRCGSRSGKAGQPLYAITVAQPKCRLVQPLNASASRTMAHVIST